MKLRLVACLAILMILLATVSHADQMIQQEPLTRLPVPEPAPDFTLQDTEGNTHRLADYRGKVVILYFWTTWCIPCRREMPSLQRTWEQVRDQDVVLLAVNFKQDEEAIARFKENYPHPVDFPIPLDRDGTVVREWEIRGLPTSFIIDPQGQVRYRVVGERDWNAPRLVETVLALRE